MAGSLPCSLRPPVLFAYYVLVCTLSGNVINATPTLKKLLRMNGTFSDLEQNGRELAFVDATSIGVSFSIVGAVVAGFIHDRLGPRFCAVMGQLSSAAGCLLMFFGPQGGSFLAVASGNALLGATYSFVSISHTSVGSSLFPGNAPIAIALICVGNDISLAVPLVLSWIAPFVGVRGAIAGYIALNLTLAVSEFFLVPGRPFDEEEIVAATLRSQRERAELQAKFGYGSIAGSTASSLSGSITSHSGGDRSSAEAFIEDEPFPILDVKQASVWFQLTTFHYWGLTAMISFSFFRKIHYLQFVGKICNTVADINGLPASEGEFITEWFQAVLPFGMIAAMLMGALTNKYGVYFGMIMVNTSAVLLSFFTSFPIMAFQWCAIFIYGMVSSFIFGLMYAYLGGCFGFASIGVLQAPLKVVCAVVSALVTPWSRGVVERLPNVLWANRILLVVSILFYIFPIAMMKLPIGGRRNHAAAQDLENLTTPPTSKTQPMSSFSSLGSEFSFAAAAGVSCALDRSSIKRLSLSFRRSAAPSASAPRYFG